MKMTTKALITFFIF